MQSLQISMAHDTQYRYRCNQCRRLFIVALSSIHEDINARCPACQTDDVMRWMSRGDRMMRFFMHYEAF